MLHFSNQDSSGIFLATTIAHISPLHKPKFTDIFAVFSCHCIGFFCFFADFSCFHPLKFMIFTFKVCPYLFFRYRTILITLSTPHKSYFTIDHFDYRTIPKTVTFLSQNPIFYFSLHQFFIFSNNKLPIFKFYGILFQVENTTQAFYK